MADATPAAGFFPKLVPRKVITEFMTAPLKGTIWVTTGASYVKTISNVLKFAAISIPTNAFAPIFASTRHVTDVVETHCDVAQNLSPTIPFGVLLDRPKFAPFTVIDWPPVAGVLYPRTSEITGPSYVYPFFAPPRFPLTDAPARMPAPTPLPEVHVMLVPETYADATQAVIPICPTGFVS